MPLHPTALRLIETATALVDRDGPEVLTVRRLLDESGVSMGSLYHHLGSFDEILVAVVDGALAAWSDAFLAALRRRGLAAAYAADRVWTRRHPGLAAAVASAGRRGALGASAERFGAALRTWLDENGLARGAPAPLVAALVLGPLTELRRLDGATGRPTTAADLERLAGAVEAALRAIGRADGSVATSRAHP
jgi:AcrR family transcriptional regulator